MVEHGTDRPASTAPALETGPPSAAPEVGLAQFAPGSAECGVALVAHLSGEPSHETVDRALAALDRLEHRGAEGADVETGDGAGILLQMPDALLRAVTEVELPPLGS